MRSPFAIAAVVAAVLFLPSTASSAGLSDADMTFVKQAAAGGMAEVQLGKLGVEKASDPSVKEFGQRMVDDHSKANDELIKILSDQQAEIPRDLPPDAEVTKQHMAALSGADFDRQYMAHMIADHQKAAELFAGEAKTGENPQLKQFAEKTLPTVREHLEQAQQIAAGLRQVATGESPEQQVAPAAGGNATGTTVTGTTAESAAMQEAARTPSRLGLMTADELIGQNVINENGEDVGTIEDIVLNANDKAVLAILSVGGFLGIGDKNVAVPFEQLEPGHNEAILMSSATEEQLKSLPEYVEGQAGFTAAPRDRPIGETQ